MIETTPTEIQPNILVWIIIQAMGDVIGDDDSKVVLKEALLLDQLSDSAPDQMNPQFEFDQICKIMVAMETIYGPRAGRGLTIRIGRSSFSYILREYGKLLGFIDQSYKLLPWNEKINHVIRSLAKVFNSATTQKVSVNDEPTQLTLNIENCGVCWERISDVPICYLVTGMIHEALYWASSGKYFAVEETECQAMGYSSCKIVISRLPLL